MPSASPVRKLRLAPASNAAAIDLTLWNRLDDRHLYMRVGFLFRRVQQLFETFAASDLETLDVTLPQMEALVAIGSAPLPDQRTVARLLGLDAATVTLVIDGLERKKLALRAIHEDRRRRVLAVSPQGKRLLSSARPRLKRASSRLLQPLSTSAATQLIRDLSVLAAHENSSAPAWIGTDAGGMQRTAPIDDLMRSPGFLTRRALQVCNAMFHAHTADHGISSQQYATFEAIAEFPDLDQAALSRVTWSGRSTAVPLLRALEARGYILRAGAEGDGRRRVFQLQPKGRAKLDAMYPGIKQSEVLFLSPLRARRAGWLIQRLREIVLAHGALHWSAPR